MGVLREVRGQVVTRVAEALWAPDPPNLGPLETAQSEGFYQLLCSLFAPIA
jgi:hypothetical protein